MAKLLIIYHSQTGNTEAMATAVSEGASSAGATVVLKRAANATDEDLLSCDAAAIGTPAYMGYMAGLVKDFFDRSFHAIRGNVDNKPYAVFSSAGGGGRQALESVEGICNHIGMNKAFEGIVARGKPSSEVLEECRELGRKLAQL